MAGAGGKLWNWLTQKAWPWLKANWKAILEALGAVLAIIFVGKVVQEVRQAIQGKVARQDNWQPVPGDPGTIVVKQGNTWTPLRLPPSVNSSQVKAVQLDPGGPGIVEVVSHADISHV